MVSDPIADLLIQIKNASMVGKRTVALPSSKMKFALATLLAKEGYIARVEKTGTFPREQLKITLKYQGKTSVFTNVVRRSKPGLRVYVNASKIPTVVGGLGIAILSTPAGIMTGTEARKRNTGGELLCEIW